jgi:hypothetical protein
MKKLSLQVPAQPGGNVRLATPPPPHPSHALHPPQVSHQLQPPQPPRVTLNDTYTRSERTSRAPSEHRERRSSADFFNVIDEEASEIGIEDLDRDDDAIDWRKRAIVLARKLKAAQAELKAVKRRVMDAIM